ncbi:hypothetical protein ACW9UR_16025 [Halovulum sp. GXIMD14794]
MEGNGIAGVREIAGIDAADLVEDLRLDDGRQQQARNRAGRNFIQRHCAANVDPEAGGRIRDERVVMGPPGPSRNAQSSTPVRAWSAMASAKHLPRS